MEDALSVLPLAYSPFWLAVWTSSALTATAYGLGARPGLRKAVGMGLMLVLLWIAAWGFLNNIPALTSGDSFLPARSTYRLSSTYIRSILIDVGYLGVGFVLWAGLPESLRDAAARLRSAGFRVARSERWDARAGWLVFPVFLAVTAAINYLVYSQTPQLVNGDESQVWRNMTPYHAVMISAAAAFTEELVYRVLGLAVFAWLLRRIGASERGALWGGVVLQALLFAAAHGGYGTWAHVLLPLLFGLFTGVLVLFFGVWSAVVIHFLIDLYAFGNYAIPDFPWLEPVLWTLLAINVLHALLVAGRWALRRQRGGRTTPA